MVNCIRNSYWSIRLSVPQSVHYRHIFDKLVGCKNLLLNPKYFIKLHFNFELKQIDKHVWFILMEMESHMRIYGEEEESKGNQ